MTRFIAVLLLSGCASTYQLQPPPTGMLDGYELKREGSFLTRYEYNRDKDGAPAGMRADTSLVFSQYPDLSSDVRLVNGLDATQWALTTGGVVLSAIFLANAVDGDFRTGMKRSGLTLSITALTSIALGLYRNHVYGSLGEEYNRLLLKDPQKNVFATGTSPR